MREKVTSTVFSVETGHSQRLVGLLYTNDIWDPINNFSLSNQRHRKISSFRRSPCSKTGMPVCQQADLSMSFLLHKPKENFG